MSSFCATKFTMGNRNALDSLFQIDSQISSICCFIYYIGSGIYFRFRSIVGMHPGSRSSRRTYTCTACCPRSYL